MSSRSGEAERRSAPTFSFIGVTTAGSSSMKVFPAWMREIGREEVAIEGVDCRIHDDPGVYRSVVARIREDPNSLGGLVTTHKIDLLEAARDMFDYLDPYATTTGEVSSISKRGGRLEGHAKDPITVGLSLDTLVPRGHFGATGGEVLIFGGGGSSAATLLNLAKRSNPAERPRRITIVDPSRRRLDALRAMVETRDFELDLIANGEASVNDDAMERLPDHSLVINATGMGKDIPGSPVSDRARFPRSGFAWEFNYRGRLPFLHQALAQRESRNLRVEDGWVYFLHGWAEVIAQVLHIAMTQELFERLARSAERAVGRRRAPEPPR